MPIFANVLESAVPAPAYTAGNVFKRIIRTASRVITAIGICAGAAPVAAPQGLDAPPAIEKPPDGSGIKWSTVKLALKPVVLANNDKTTLPLSWNPYNSTYRSSFFSQYTVELQQANKAMIPVWVLPEDPPPAAPKAEKDKWGDFKYWCHGLTFGGAMLYSPAGNVVKDILAAGWTKPKACVPKPPMGDIIVYIADATKTGVLNKGDVVHTALSLKR